MDVLFINCILGFLEGFALILSPCILPILPVFIAVSLQGGKKRPLGMLLGFVLFFALIIFFSRQLTTFIGINLDWLRYGGYFILMLLGIMMVTGYGMDKFTQWLSSWIKTDVGAQLMQRSRPGFFSGIILGGLLAVIWTPCAGPILAAVLVQTVIQKADSASFLILLFFAAGAVLPLFVLALYGQKLVKTFDCFKKYLPWWRKILGLLLLISLVYLIFFANSVGRTDKTVTGVRVTNTLLDGLLRPYPAPAISGITTWINSTPVDIAALRGKVILIDFWTYSCINCLRSLPYIKEWYTRYHQDGLVVIGIHTPEFAFEKNSDNVRAAVKRLGILYPVALDNNYATWINYGNHYWPAHYLINKEGQVVYQHFGEGDYDVTEANIRYLLGVREQMTKSTISDDQYHYLQTPEIYLGYGRADPRIAPRLYREQTVSYEAPPMLKNDSWALTGDWQAKQDYLTTIKDAAALKLNFRARKVYAVMESANGKELTVTIFVQGIKVRELQVKEAKLYELYTQDKIKRKELKMVIHGPGLNLYTFTFGS
ncbi:MAG: cytochrome C biogenesis protein [Legionella sp. 40-6]|nr:cytochrome c biogenesis protein DipZ [Legionella sp.]OJY11798.1 MAG: cytochrome C biogenesis protein [Legionella sp. 40-6]